MLAPTATSPLHGHWPWTAPTSFVPPPQLRKIGELCSCSNMTYFVQLMLVLIGAGFLAAAAAFARRDTVMPNGREFGIAAALGFGWLLLF